MDEKQTLTIEQARKLYKRKTQAMIADIILIILLLGVAFYLFSNFTLAKQIESGELNPCNVCEDNYKATCTTIGYDKTYWSKEDIEEARQQEQALKDFNFSDIEISGK